MKFWISLVILTLFSQASFSSSDVSPMDECVRALTNKSGEVIEVTPVWNELHRKNFKRMSAVNGILAETIATFFKAKKRFPLEYEIIKALKKAVAAKDLREANQLGNENLLAKIINSGLKEYFKMDGSADSLLGLYALSVHELSDVYGPFRLKIAKLVAKSFSTRLSVPSFSELADRMGLVKAHLKIVIGDPVEFMAFAQSEYRTDFLKANDRLAKAFLEDMRQTDRPQRLRTRSSTPDIEGLFDALGRVKGADELRGDILANDFKLSDLRELLGQSKAKKSDLARPVLFAGGIEELEKYTRTQNSNAFQSHTSSKYFGKERQELLVKKIESSRGMMVATYAANFPIEEQQFQAMLAYAEDRDLVIVLIPELGTLDGVDPRFLENDRVFILTHTIQNKALRLWNIPLGSKQVNPFAGTDLARSTVTGQTTVVGSPQQMMAMIPRAGSDLADTSVWSPGSISTGVYPFRMPIQGRTAYLAEGRHTNGFTVFEKANSNAGPLKLGAINTWHPRNVEVMLQKEDDAGGNPVTTGAYFNDYGHFYGYNKNGLVKMEKGAKALILGDLHDAKTLQAIMPHIKKYIEENIDLEVIVLHDPLDGDSHNHHEKDRLNQLAEKLRTGRLDMLQEYLNLVQTVNALLSIRDNLRVVMVDSNHSYWAKNLAENPPALQKVINGEFVGELGHVLTRTANRARDPLHYVFDKMGRELTLSQLSEDALHQTPGSSVRLIDPDRVQVLEYGKKLTVGSADRQVDIHLHGHLGANGAKGSARSHAANGGNITTGDSHRVEIKLDFMNVGTLTEKKMGYNDAGYSSWAHGWGLIYEDGSKQLIIYNETADSFRQDPDQPILPADQYFGDDPLKVQPNSNDLFNGAFKSDQYSRSSEVPPASNPNDSRQ